jgi:hypothetical protein
MTIAAIPWLNTIEAMNEVTTTINRSNGNDDQQQGEKCKQTDGSNPKTSPENWESTVINISNSRKIPKKYEGCKWEEMHRANVITQTRLTGLRL